MDEMGIGEFASRSRLSARALAMDDELGLLVLARVDEDSGYRFYEPGQLRQARLIALAASVAFPAGGDQGRPAALEACRGGGASSPVLGRDREQALVPSRARYLSDRRAERKEVRRVRGQDERDTRAQPAMRQ